MPLKQVARDNRIDMIRGLAVICMLLDHIPGNPAARFTLQAFGFSDASEVFVLMSGISVGIAYCGQNKSLEFYSLVKKIMQRSAKLYVAHILMLCALLAAVAVAPELLRKTEPDAYVFYLFAGGNKLESIYLVLCLAWQPEYFDILPMYIIIFIVWLPVAISILWRFGVTCLFVVSCALWFAALWSGYNLHSQRPGGWFFNPMSWQFIFSIGLVVGSKHHATGGETAPTLLRVLALSIVIFGVIVSIAPLNSYLIILNIGDYTKGVGKTFLPPLRLAHVLCLYCLVSWSISRDAEWVHRPPFLWICTIGRSPLRSFIITAFLSHVAAIALSFERGILGVVTANGASLLGLYSFTVWQSSGSAHFKKFLLQHIVRKRFVCAIVKVGLARFIHPTCAATR
jgi:hypothetical protein